MTPMSDRRGFTLLSVLVAVTMLTIALLSVAQTQARLTAAESGVASRAEALAVAGAYMEQLRGSDPSKLASEGPVAVDRDGNPAGAGPYQWSTVVSLDRDNLVRLRVLVDYPRATTPVELVTLLYRRVP